MTRLNLQIDAKFADVLSFLRTEYPLLSDPDLIKIAVGSFYNQLQLKKQKDWAASLPVLQLTDAQTAQLELDLAESVASGFETWDRETFLKEMAS